MDFLGISDDTAQLFSWYILSPNLLAVVLMPAALFFFFCRCADRPPSWTGGGIYLFLTLFLRLLFLRSGPNGFLLLLMDIGLLALTGGLSLKKSPGASFACSALTLSVGSLCSGIARWASLWAFGPLTQGPLFLLHLSDTLRELLALLLFLLLSQIILRFFQRSITSSSQSILFLLTIPVFFIALVERTIQDQVYGDTIVVDDALGIVFPIIDHTEILFLQLFACVCLLFSLAAFQKALDGLRARQTICLLEQQAREQEIYIHEAMLRDQKTRAFRHDIKNHLLVLTQLLQDKQDVQAYRYLLQLKEDLSPLSLPIHTGNAAADALLGSKAAFAEQKGIDLSCQLSLPKTRTIPDTDWCIVLANAVDNGISACAALQSDGQKKKPFIHIQGRCKGDLFLLIVENSCDPRLTEPPADGIGLSNIRAVAEKHKGAFQNKAADGIYRLDLLLPLSPTDPSS